MPDGEQDAVVAIVGAQDHPPEGRGRSAAVGVVAR